MRLPRGGLVKVAQAAGILYTKRIPRKQKKELKAFIMASVVRHARALQAIEESQTEA